MIALKTRRRTGLLALQRDTDIQKRAQYINLGRSTCRVPRERTVGFLGAAGSSTELSKIADLVGNTAWSVNEVGIGSRTRSVWPRTLHQSADALRAVLRDHL